MRIALGLLLGIAFAAGDGLLLHWIIKSASKQPEDAKRFLVRGFAARYLLTVAVLAIALLVPVFDPIYVVIPLIVQKAVLVICTVVFGRK